MLTEITRFEKAGPGGWTLGMIVVPLVPPDVLVYSPTWLGDRTWEMVDALGRVRLLVAPNAFHHLSLARFREHYPDALAVASEQAIPLLARRGHHGLRMPEAVRGELPEGVALVDCHGTKSGELWVTARAGSVISWVVADAFFHVGSARGAFGLFARATKTAPGLSIGQTFRWLALRDEAVYRRWLLDRLARDVPARVVFCHGSPLEGGDVTERLRAIAETRLRAPDP